MLETLHLYASIPDDIARAAEILRAGGTVAFPTETVYGLGANALSAEAVARVFIAKGRPSWDPLIVHVPDYAHVLKLTEIDANHAVRVDRLAEAFWPGPLTLLLPRCAEIRDIVTSGRRLVGMRVPAHPAAQALLRATGLPLAAPSANRFGHTSPTTAQHVRDDLEGRIAAVLDAGPTDIGLESTVLDPTTDPMTLYRPGALTAEELAEVTGTSVKVYSKDRQVDSGADSALRNSLPAPGVDLRHYAPHAELILTGGHPDDLLRSLAQGEAGDRIGVLLPLNWGSGGANRLVEPWAQWDDHTSLAARLFAGLRNLDARGARVIYCPLPAPGGLRDALRDRLLKAARRH